MKSIVKNCILIAVSSLILAGQLTAQTFTTLHSFAIYEGSTSVNGEGANPIGVALSGNSLYGVANSGGSTGYGTLFAVSKAGLGFTNLLNWNNPYSPNSNEPGSLPQGGLIFSGGRLYGTTSQGGGADEGAVFAVNTNISFFTNLYNFSADPYPNTNADGASPQCNLILSGNTLYGVANAGGSAGYGTVFAVNTDGSGFTNLHSFGGYPSDGASPSAPLLLSGNTLYGTAYAGGSHSNGAVFALLTNGMGYTNLYNFSATLSSGTNSDGANPEAGLVLLGSTLYGASYNGGIGGYGTLFALHTDGSGFTNLHNFNAAPTYGPDTDGANPNGGLVLSGTTLYGTTSAGGTNGNTGTISIIASTGAIFAVNITGTDYRILHSFAPTTYFGYGFANYDGSQPNSLILSGSTFYGTAANGGAADTGTVFSLSFPINLTIVLSGGNAILTWPTNVAGFDSSGLALLSTTNLNAGNWSPVSPAPVVVNGRYTVTNAISATAMFFQLGQ